MSISDYTIAKRTSVWVLIVLILLGGYLSYQKLGRFEDPEFVIRQAVINTSYPGASAEQVANEVTDVIEGAVQSLQELKEVKSVSRPGMSEVTVEIKLEFAGSKAELQQVWDKLRRKVMDAQRLLPPGASAPMVNDDFADVYALFYAITADGYSDKQLQDYVDMLSRELALVPGVAKTAVLGAQQQQIFVELSAEKMLSYQVSVQQLYQVLQQQNLVVNAGSFVADGMRLPVIPAESIGSINALKQLQIGIGERQAIIRLADIADVSLGLAEPSSFYMMYNGERAVGLGISNVAGGNVVEMGRAVQAKLAQLESRRPIGMELHAISLQSESVDASVSNFIDNLIAAIAIVFVVLLIFMGVRSGIIIGFVLLLTVCGTLIIMLIDDIAMQRISLGALIIALGMLVDNAIVVTDGVLVRLQKGEDKRSAINAVVNATIWPLLGGTAVGILAFSAIGLSPSDMGEYAGSLFWVILYSMFLSWLFAVTIIPLLCYQFLTVKPVAADAPQGRIIKAYAGLLGWVLNHRKTSGLLLLALLVAAVMSMRFIPPGFMPESQRPQFVVDIYLPQGSDIEKTKAVVAQVAEQVKLKQGVTDIASFIGGGGLRFMLTYAPESRNPSYGQLLIDVEDYKQISPLLSELQSELQLAFPQTSIKVWKFMLGRGGGKKIEAGFRGEDPQVLRQLAEEAKAIMQQQPDLIAIQDDWRQQIPVASPHFMLEQAQQFGLTISDLNQAISQTLQGRTVGVYRENNDLVPIVVRAPLSEREHQRAIENAQVFSQLTGSYVPVSQFISRIDMIWQDSLVRRIDRMPTILAQADPAPGMLTAEAFATVKSKIEAIPLPPGYELTWYGEYKASKDANVGLAISAPYGFSA
ncbi:efflux RND transporter permease subunit [Shewanella marina]|uniref:efflux RND transporter permease subunit n=1 Tax=Shewanella marina TaxID=487319 RepID=UPI000A4C85EA|nr:efflux RND transporter permease subunit [Shewanella marina]